MTSRTGAAGSITAKLLILLIWLGVQPWYVFPALSAEVSQRLVLVGCGVALGLVSLLAPARHRLPWTWWSWMLPLLLVICWHQAPTIKEAAYFEWFRETAWFADGLLVCVSLTWGLWGLLQLPRAWVRLLPWIGLLWCSINLIVVLQQPWDAMGQPSGLLTVDRHLGAHAIAWLPILFIWNRWTALMPALLILACGKLSAIVGGVVILLWLRPRWWPWILLVGWLGIAIFQEGRMDLKIEQRLWTWWHTFQATLARPWTGWGFHPMTEPMIRQSYGYALPGIHSDWLSLAFHAGWPVTLMAGLGWLRELTRQAVTPLAQACQAGLCGLGVMALGQSVLSQASVMSLALILLAWWWIEQEETCIADWR